MTTVIATAFHMPSPPNEIDDVLGDIWREGNVRQLIYVKRMSSRGNPYVRGPLISDTQVPLPLEFELSHLPEDYVSVAHQNFKDEIDSQNNGTEYF